VVAQGIVDVFKIIEVQTQDGGIDRGDFECIIKAFVEQGPVGQAGQWIVHGQLMGMDDGIGIIRKKRFVEV